MLKRNSNGYAKGFILTKVVITKIIIKNVLPAIPVKFSKRLKIKPCLYVRIMVSLTWL